MDNITKFENKVKKTIKDYSLLKKGEKILVACSGGKDSITILHLLNKWRYNTEALMIDLEIGEWSKKNLDNLKHFCDKNKIKLNIVEIRKEAGYSMCYIRSCIQSKKDLNNCLICGIIKRWLLNKKARDLKADKIVTGHNLDDAAETIFMNYLKAETNLSIGQGPKTGVIQDKKFTQRVKPLYFCSNKEIKEYSQKMRFEVQYDPCPCSEGVYRRKIRNILNELEKDNPNLKLNIVNSFLKILPGLQNKFTPKEKLRYCNNCGEPARNDICKRCELFEILK